MRCGKFCDVKHHHFTPPKPWKFLKNAPRKYEPDTNASDSQDQTACKKELGRAASDGRLVRGAAEENKAV
jgi:hypothetical protein